MKQRKYFTKICAMLFLLGAFAATSVYAQGPPPYDIQQHFAIGFQYIEPSGIKMPGVNARFWSDGNVGFDIGYGRKSDDTLFRFISSGEKIKLNVDLINASLLYTVYHGDTSVVYIRPYVGGGAVISRISTDVEDRLYDSDKEKMRLGTKAGGQGFAGAEISFKAFPQLSIGGDAGYMYAHGEGESTGRFMIHFYFK